MKKIIISSALAFALIGLGGCASGPSADDAIAEAQKEMKVAKKMNYLWRDTGKILKKAKKAKANGDTKKAVKLANKALSQAKMAQAQAKAEANPKIRF
ncbi:MAG: SoxXA-binding protein [Acidiferrobacterales bacterium]